MRILKKSDRKQPRLSLILLDWGVRESFHLLHYLKDQTISRDAFEVILVEFYSGISEPLQKYESEVDTWILLQMPAACYYHKHLMYNVGTVFSKGEILMIADSDAMVRPTFVETVLRAFERDPLMVYHMDEFRNVRRDLYPFNYPSFEEVLGDGSINNVDGKTKGVLDVTDPMHTKNYGACMCARREDIIAIGGADEDMTYLGHICGPYDMTFRLMNFERRMCWETGEYLYHTWHPGSDGVDNYLGPHDGRNMSTTAFEALYSGRIPPLVENEAIRLLRTGGEVDLSGAKLYDLLVNPDYVEAFNRANLGAQAVPAKATADGARPLFASYRGYDIHSVEDSFYAVPASAGPMDPSADGWTEDERVLQGRSFQELRELIDTYETHLLETIGASNVCRVGERFAVIPHVLGPVNLLLRSHRENPGITWAESVGEARRVAGEIAAASQNGGAVHASEGARPVSHSQIATIAEADMAPLRTGIEDLRREIEELQRWMTRAEMDRAYMDRAGMDRSQVHKAEIDHLQERINYLESALAAVNQQRTADTELVSEQVGNLQRQLSAADSGLAAIYQSRTWRALVRIGRALPGGGKTGAE